MSDTTKPNLLELAKKVDELSIRQKLRLAIGLLDHGQLGLAETIIHHCHLELAAARLLGRSPKL